MGSKQSGGDWRQKVNTDYRLLPAEADPCRAKRFKRTLVKIRDPIPNEEIVAQELFSTFTENVHETVDQNEQMSGIQKTEHNKKESG
ncbi:hypothetical protein O3M35_009490 [Rhynocoris fuscipes]|uniref:Uncharacterized protein n=1 Tax=Rhynocoris fuscipes TaxID=488301 RepID=A0AAW1D4J1_9HEMI